MRVFISWSGEPSRSVAIALRDWLPDVMQFVDPFMSAADIDAGSKWGQVLDRELSGYSFGLICLTRENQTAPWIHFEAGALAKAIATGTDQQPRVCPYLIDLAATDLAQGPLTQFQAKIANEEGTRDLVRAVNDAAGESALDLAALERSFRRCWSELQQKLESLPKRQPSTPRRSTEDMIEEVLTTTREIARVQRQQSRAAEEMINPEWARLFEKRAALRARRKQDLPTSHIAHWKGVLRYLTDETKAVMDPSGTLLEDRGASYRIKFRVGGKEVHFDMHPLRDAPLESASLFTEFVQSIHESEGSAK